LRENEDRSRSDLKLVTEDEFESRDLDYIYEYGGARYGIARSAIEKALQNYKSVFIIVRSIDIMRRLREDFALHSPTTAFIYLDRSITDRSRNLSPEVRASVQQAFEDYLVSPEDYDEVVIDGGSRQDFHRLLNVLIQRGADGSRSRSTQTNEVSSSFTVVCSMKVRRTLQALVAAAFAASCGILINIISGEKFDFGRNLALGALSALSFILVWLEILLTRSWRSTDQIAPN
jgi:hypothetical protein